MHAATGFSGRLKLNNVKINFLIQYSYIQHNSNKISMKIIDIQLFEGQHCETTATGTLLLQLGINLSEPLLFGLGEGLGFIFWNMKTMDFPFIGGRIKPDSLTANIARNLHLKLNVSETHSATKAWAGVKHFLDNGQLVGLKMDCYHLEYFTNPIHFAGHYAAIYGYDETKAYLVDTSQQGSRVQTSHQSLALARSEKGPMASKNLFYTLALTDETFDLEKAIIQAMKNNAFDFLNPPISNIGYKGILKASSEVIKWFQTSKNREHDFKLTAVLMERAGTGGALFRNLYRDFLKESLNITPHKNIEYAYKSFIEIAEAWTRIAALFEKTGETQDFKYIQEIASILKELSDKERKAMSYLLEL